MSPLQAHMVRYRAEHRTTGCRISHMIGVPMIVASVPVLILNWRIGLALFILGWTFQFAGHRYFERNKPVLMADPKNPLTYLAALIYVGQEWVQMFTIFRWAQTVRVTEPPPASPPVPDRARAA